MGDGDRDRSWAEGAPAVVTCAGYGKVAATFWLIPAAGKLELTPEGERILAQGPEKTDVVTRRRWEAHVFGDKPRLVQTGFLGRLTIFGDAPDLVRQWEAVKAGTYWRSIDADLVHFHCRRCDRPYCIDCWEHWPVWYDPMDTEIRGRCPSGHEQALDD